MSSENIFDLVQKKTPYRVPENYFGHPKQSKKWYWAVAASLLLVLAAWSVIRYALPSSPATDTAIYSSATATDNWQDFAEADLFLENMNW